MLFSEDTSRARVIIHFALYSAIACLIALPALLVLNSYLNSGNSTSLPVADSAVAAKPFKVPHSGRGAQFADAGKATHMYVAHHYHPYIKPKPKPAPPPPPPPSPPEPAPVAPAGSYQGYAQSLFASYGWSSSEFGCLDQLWNRESGWNPQATNPYSGAFGIPQALPGSKMASAGADWATNGDTQIRWGLGYIHAVYGTPCGAWAHSEATGAY